MLRTMLTSSALAACLVCTACDQPLNQQAQRDQQSQPPSEQAMNDQQTAPSPATQPYPSGGNTMQPDQTAAIPIRDVQNPEQTLAQASVKDSKGAAIGEVASVNVGPDGRVQTVNVEVGTRTVALEATNLTYVQAENTIVSTKSKEEIQATP